MVLWFYHIQNLESSCSHVKKRTFIWKLSETKTTMYSFVGCTLHKNMLSKDTFHFVGIFHLCIMTTFQQMAVMR